MSQVVDALEKSRQELEALKESAAVSERNAKLTESELKQKLSELEQQKEKELESARQRAAFHRRGNAVPIQPAS